MTATAAVYNRLHNSSLGGSVAHHTQLARSLERILEEAHHSGELILTNRKLKDFPKTGTKYNLTDTIIADLSRNRFCELPEEITSFSFLETLLLYHNTIRSIPESVKQLTSLTYLDLRSNQLSALPREICFLPLQVFLVSNNRLTALPDELGRMDRLTDLDASYNQLTTLPPRIGELHSLRSLSLRSNQLMYLPRELTCLSLVSLDVSNNRIASLPLEIRQLSTLVEFDLENNPLTSPPASLCIRGLVHVFKYLEIQATKDEKGSRAGGNYDGYTTLRRAPRHNSNSNILETSRSARPNVDSGYSTCDGIDKRWSHDMPSGVKPKVESPIRRTPTTPPSSLTSSTSTIVGDTSLSKSSNESSPKKINVDSPQKQQSIGVLHHHINYAQSSSSSGSSPDQDDLMIDHNQPTNKADEKTSKNLGNIQTYREYKEALKQQRNLEISSVYKIKGQKTLYDMTDVSNALNSNCVAPEDVELRFNGTGHTGSILKSIMKNGSNANGSNGLHGINGMTNGPDEINGGDDDVIIPKKPVQKVIPLASSQATKNQINDTTKSGTLLNGDCLGYVKPSSPMMSLNGTTGSGSGGILTNNKKLNGTISLKSPVGGATKLGTQKTNRTVTWNQDISSEKLSFTMRREFDRQREETELMTQLRSIIETRLKMTLPEDIASALTDGVILCHLANYVRPRSVASIHVPSPGVSKLTMARCRRNVDNFLEACRRIGVDEELICSCADVVPSHADEANHKTNYNNNCEDMQSVEQHESERRISLPNAPAVLKTVSALIAMDFNPHHQNIRNLQQQHELRLKMQQQQQERHQQEQSELEDQQQSNGFIHQQHHSIEADEQYHLDQQQEQETTATFTQEQMHQQSNVAADMQLGNPISLREKCQFDNSVYGNGIEINLSNGYNFDDDQYNDDYDDNIDVVGHTPTKANYDYDDDDGNIVAASNAIKINYQQSQQQQHGGVVKKFLRHAKLKSFQKIKLNLISSHGNNNSIGNHCVSPATTLQTIVETDSDVGISSVGVGVYQLINEKLDNVENGPTADTVINQYKLLELPTNGKCEIHESGANVSKRIEFFEHSSSHSTNTNSNVAKSGKAKSSIFSIYHVPSVVDAKLPKDPSDVKDETASPLFVHDSHVLTIILSCVFIVTFLLLIFFPLPG